MKVNRLLFSIVLFNILNICFVLLQLRKINRDIHFKKEKLGNFYNVLYKMKEFFMKKNFNVCLFMHFYLH